MPAVANEGPEMGGIGRKARLRHGAVVVHDVVVSSVCELKPFPRPQRGPARPVDPLSVPVGHEALAHAVRNEACGGER